MRRNTVRAALAAAVFAAGAAAGALWLGREPWQLAPVVQAAEHYVRPVEQDNLLLAVFIFFKNLSVVLVALFAEQTVSAADRLRARAAAALKLPPALARVVAVEAGRLGRLVPVVVLAVNGNILAGVCCLLLESGTGAVSLAAGLLPHGLPELSALFLACGASIAGAAPGEKVTLLQRAVVPLLAAAAVLEVWVTPEVMRLLY